MCINIQNGEDGDIVEIILDTATNNTNIKINGNVNTTFTDSTTHLSIEANGIDVTNTSNDNELSLCLECGVCLQVSVLDFVKYMAIVCFLPSFSRLYNKFLMPWFQIRLFTH